MEPEEPASLPAGRRIRRRAAVRLGLGIAAGLTLPAIGGGIAYNFGAFEKTVNLRRFELPFRIPPVLAPTSSDATTDYYDITPRIEKVELLPGLRTAVWGYNGTFPGPTIRARSNRQAVVRHLNALPEAVSVHLHGGVQPPESDGYPTDLIPPGGSKVVRASRSPLGNTGSGCSMPPAPAPTVSLSALTSHWSRLPPKEACWTAPSWWTPSRSPRPRGPRS